MKRVSLSALFFMGFEKSTKKVDNQHFSYSNETFKVFATLYGFSLKFLKNYKN
jgi:hypothetical protein